VRTKGKIRRGCNSGKEEDDREVSNLKSYEESVREGDDDMGVLGNGVDVGEVDWMSRVIKPD